MSKTDASTILSPEVYASWRATTLGGVTEAVEQHLIFDMMGDLAGRRVLDAGCGDGALVLAAASRGADATGIDPNPAMLAAARLRAQEARVPAIFSEGRVERLPFPDAAFDVVTAVTVLCFVPNAAGAVREMARVLRPGGRLILGELGRWSLWATIRRVRGWLSAGIWRDARFRTAAELRGLIEQAGLSVTEVRGAVYYPPVGLLARVLAPFDPWLSGLTTFGAAFVAVGAVSDNRRRKE
jgi:ubiquinone/menaquinone biosynthesis C-methylase UbiE